MMTTKFSVGHLRKDKRQQKKDNCFHVVGGGEHHFFLN